jgi:hypothetical protein
MKKEKTRKRHKEITQLSRVAAAIGSTLGVIVAKAGTATKALRTRTVRARSRRKKAAKKS